MSCFRGVGVRAGACGIVILFGGLAACGKGDSSGAQPLGRGSGTTTIDAARAGVAVVAPAVGEPSVPPDGMFPYDASAGSIAERVEPMTDRVDQRAQCAEDRVDPALLRGTPTAPTRLLLADFFIECGLLADAATTQYQGSATEAHRACIADAARGDDDIRVVIGDVMAGDRAPETLNALSLWIAQTNISCDDR
jgi:hypothetical protein